MVVGLMLLTCRAVSLLIYIQFAQLLLVSGSAPLQLISPEGILKPISQIDNFITIQSPANEQENIISFIDCTYNDGDDLLNRVFSSKFTRENGITLEVKKSETFLYCYFESMYSDKFCGAKVADFCKHLPGKVCTVMKGNELSSALIGYDQIFRRILRDNKANDGSREKIHLYFLIDNTNSNIEKDINIITEKIQSTMQRIWMESNKPQNLFEDRVDLQIMTIQSMDDKNYLKNLREMFTLQKIAIPTLTLPKLVTEAWNKIPMGEALPVLSPVDRDSMVAIEMAYSDGFIQSEIAISQWYMRVSQGKIVAKFADRVNTLLKTIKTEFNKKTAGTSTLRVRNDRFRLLTEHIQKAALTLFRQQLTILETQSISTFRKVLIQLVADGSFDSMTESSEAETTTPPTPPMNKNEFSQALRKQIFDFKAKVSELEDETLGLSATTTITELTTILESILKEFPETAAYKLEEVKKLGKIVKKPRKKKGKFSIKPTFNLVGMLRPPGFGNLQGFVSYGTSLLGYPLECILGVQNDGDAPEIMGDDREYPLLRLQPKVNFDIDI